MNSPMVIITHLVWKGLGFVKDSLIPQMSRSDSRIVYLVVTFFKQRPIHAAISINLLIESITCLCDKTKWWLGYSQEFCAKSVQKYIIFLLS